MTSRGKNHPSSPPRGRVAHDTRRFFVIVKCAACAAPIRREPGTTRTHCGPCRVGLTADDFLTRAFRLRALFWFARRPA